MYEFVISPEPFVEKCKDLGRAKRVHLEVVDGRIRIAWTDDVEAGFMEWADLIGLGISYDLLEDALSEAGGAIDINGSYPINETIMQRLRKLFTPLQRLTF